MDLVEPPPDVTPVERTAYPARPSPETIPFNRPFTTGHEFEYIREASANLHLSGNGPFTDRCCRWLAERVGCTKALLTPSCTSALEMAALLAGVGPGDEVIMPSFSFVSSASAMAIRGATAVFVDVRPDTLNLDESLVEAAITPRTRAILPVHYAGVGCHTEPLAVLAERYGLYIIEDAAQGISASYQGKPLGSVGDVGCLSFHETKNVTCGEGGALLINRPEWVERAEVLQEKGTNRSQFFRGQVDKYTWVELGSSFLTSEINAAFLWAQLQAAPLILGRRMDVWRQYHSRLAPLEQAGLLRRPIVPEQCEHNAHMYYLLLPNADQRDRFIADLRHQGVQTVFHYVPLHSAPAGLKFGRAQGDMKVTDSASERLVRLPLWVGMEQNDVDRVVAAVELALT